MSSLGHLEEYFKRVSNRLTKAEKIHGDAARDFSLTRLVDEVEEELLDVLGWGFFAWLRLQQMKERMNEVNEGVHELESDLSTRPTLLYLEKPIPREYAVACPACHGLFDARWPTALRVDLLVYCSDVCAGNGRLTPP